LSLQFLLGTALRIFQRPHISSRFFGIWRYVQYFKSGQRMGTISTQSRKHMLLKSYLLWMHGLPTKQQIARPYKNNRHQIFFKNITKKNLHKENYSREKFRKRTQSTPKLHNLHGK
jgi:hypothetical protein